MSVLRRKEKREYSSCDHENSRIEGGAKDKNLGNTSKPGDKRARIAPVQEAKGRPIGYATSNIDNREDVEGDETNELEQREPEFRLAKRHDAQELKAGENGPEDEKPAPDGDRVCPENEDGGDGIVLVGEHSEPDDEVIPADAETQ